ncbi:MAG: dienelactone hydrolase family protein [Xenococcaceae cyanobacterium]
MNFARPPKLKVYENAEHSFFCHERSAYNPSAAKDAWYELTGFLKKYLKN